MLILNAPNATLFPYTTLFRSRYILFIAGQPKRPAIETLKKLYEEIRDDYPNYESGELETLFLFLDLERPSSPIGRSEEHTSELQSRGHLVCRLLLEKKK